MLINWSKDTHDEEGGGCVLSNLVSCSRVGTFNHQLDCLAPGKCLRNGYCCHVVFLSKAVSLWRARTWFRGLMTNFLEAETKVSRDYEAGCQCPPVATQTPSCLRNMAALQTLQPSLSQTAGPATQICTAIGHKTATNRNYDMPGILRE